MSVDELVKPAPAPAPVRKAAGSLLRERVTDIRHYTDKLFSFRTTRSAGFRFTSGQFAMIGLEVEGRPLLRAYSMASAYYDDHLEFFSIKVPNGPLTSRLQHIKLGDEIVINPKPTGTLLLGNLRPGRRLFLLCSGTGFAPFGSILRDPDVYEAFDSVVVVYGCRVAAELAYATNVCLEVRQHELLGEAADAKLVYYATVTRKLKDGTFWHSRSEMMNWVLGNANGAGYYVTRYDTALEKKQPIRVMAFGSSSTVGIGASSHCMVSTKSL